MWVKEDAKIVTVEYPIVFETAEKSASNYRPHL